MTHNCPLYAFSKKVRKKHHPSECKRLVLHTKRMVTGKERGIFLLRAHMGRKSRRSQSIGTGYKG